MVRLIQSLHTSLNLVGRLEYSSLVDGLSPMKLMHTRKVMLDVPPLERAIRAAQSLKREGDV